MLQPGMQAHHILNLQESTADNLAIMLLLSYKHMIHILAKARTDQKFFWEPTVGLQGLCEAQGFLEAMKKLSLCMCLDCKDPTEHLLF